MIYLNTLVIQDCSPNPTGTRPRPEDYYELTPPVWAPVEMRGKLKLNTALAPHPSPTEEHVGDRPC